MIFPSQVHIEDIFLTWLHSQCGRREVLRNVRYHQSHTQLYCPSLDLAPIMLSRTFSTSSLPDYGGFQASSWRVWVGSNSLEAKLVTGDLNHCIGFSLLCMRISLLVGGWGALLRSCTLPIANTVPFCLFVFQEAMNASPECQSHYRRGTVKSYLDYLFKVFWQ